jgi:phosphoribosyl-AMP cyclohydrolase
VFVVLVFVFLCFFCVAYTERQSVGAVLAKGEQSMRREWVTGKKRASVNHTKKTKNKKCEFDCVIVLERRQRRACVAPGGVEICDYSRKSCFGRLRK